MADPRTDKGLDEAFARMKEKVAQEVEQHKDEDVDLGDLEDVSGGAESGTGSDIGSTAAWKITYET